MIIYQIPAVMNQIFVNLHIKPQKISTDTILFNTSKFAISRYVGYNCFNSNIYSKIERIQENLSDNPFAYRLFFLFLMNYKNVFICPNNEELTLDGAYHAPQEKVGGNKIKISLF